MLAKLIIHLALALKPDLDLGVALVFNQSLPHRRISSYAKSM